jgi:glycosyltransferase involved in cell wall biosynthesis
MHDAELFIVGTGSSTMEFGESCGIRGVPFAKWDEMDAWYSSCPYLVATSRFEGGHSLAVLEAMSYGAIVFVSPIASNTEVVKNGKNGCVLSCVDPAADAALICGVAEQKKTFDYLREKAFLTAMNNKWDRQAARLERVLCR